MKKETKQIIKLTGMEILRAIESALISVDLALSKNKREKFLLYKYLEDNSIERSDFLRKISVLKKKGYIERFCEGKESYAEITEKGKKSLNKYEFSRLNFQRPEHWDKRWRVIISDIPEKQRVLRNGIRAKLYEVGFLQIQKSVFVFPFECTPEINRICDILGGRHFIKYLIADIIEGESDITEKFIDKGILKKADLEWG